MVRRKNFVFFSSAFLITIALIALSRLSAFRLFGVPVMEPTFADLRLITSASECLQASTWSMTSESCDPWGRPFNYPSLWVQIFSIFNVTERDTNSLGIAEIIVLGMTLSYWLRRVVFSDSKFQIRPQLLFLALFVFSPPVLLLAERGNVDILIFAGLTLAAEVLRRKWYLFAVSIVVILGTLKIYPFAGILIPFLALSNWLKRIWIFFVSLLGGLIIFGELSLISDRSVTSWNSISYGMNLIPLILFQKFQIPDSRNLAAISGILLFVAVSIILWRLFGLNIRLIAETIRDSDSFNSDFQLFGSVFVLSYLVGTSYDYRLVICLPIFMILFSLALSLKEKVFFLGLSVSIMYGGHLLYRLDSIGVLLNTVSDGLILLSTSTLFLILVQLNLSRIVRHK